MSFEETVESMRRRMPWPVAQRVLASQSVERGQGWDKTVSKLLNPETNVDAEAESDLAHSLREHILCGEKLSRFFPVNNQQKQALRDALLGAAIQEDELQAAYPASLSEQSLAGLDRGLRLVSVEELEDGLAGVFTSIRTLTIREPLEADDLPVEAADVLQEYDEIVGIKNVRLQVFDVVWIPENGDLIDVRVDYPRGMHQAAGEAAHEQILAHLIAIAGSANFEEPSNLFPLIDQMYRDAGEGIVVELGFGTTTASTKLEKMRRQSLDLREERYHVGGKQNLNAPIEPFKLTIRWRRAIGANLFSYPELTLNGSQRLAGSDDPRLLSVSINRCLGIEDYDFVRSRIEHHLSNIS